jgi:hypothetical protein
MEGTAPTRTLNGTTRSSSNTSAPSAACYGEVEPGQSPTALVDPHDVKER